MNKNSMTSQRFYCPSCESMFRNLSERCPPDGCALEPALGDPMVGRTLGDRYQIETLLGDGGVGRVYRARHTRMSRWFAVKVMYSDFVEDAKMRERFAREAEAACALAHPNLVR